MNLEEVGGALARVAKGELELSQLAGMNAEQLTAILSLALSQLRAGKDAEATRLLRALVALDDRNPLFHMYLGLALERAKDLPGALAEYSANISCTKDQSELCQAHLLRCRAYLMAGDVVSARADLAAAKRIDDGNDPTVRQELAQLEHLAGGAT